MPTWSPTLPSNSPGIRTNNVRARLAGDERSPGESSSCIPEWLYLFFWAFGLIFVDLVIYGFVVPFAAVHLGGKLTERLEIGPAWETLLIVFTVFCVLCFIFKWRLESAFWKHFFSGDVRFKRILHIRDGVNTIAILFLCFKMYQILQKIVSDQGMHDKNLHQGVTFVILRKFFTEEYLERDLHIQPTLDVRYFNPQFGDDATPFYDQPDNETSNFLVNIWNNIINKFGSSDEYIIDQVEFVILLRRRAIHGAQFLIVVAQLAAAITKLIYFNSLYAYHRAMDIFISMQRDGALDSPGSSMEDDDYVVIYDDVRPEDDASPVTIHKKGMATDFLRRKDTGQGQPQKVEPNDTKKPKLQGVPLDQKYGY